MSVRNFLELIGLFALFAYSAQTLAGDGVAEAETWARDSYAPLWSEETWNKLEDVLDHYAEQVTTYGADGEITVNNPAEWMGDSVTGWRDEGWLGADLTAMHTHVINASTVAFTMQWNDRYQDIPNETSCGWYLANRIQGQWRFTAYADTNCP